MLALLFSASAAAQDFGTLTLSTSDGASVTIYRDHFGVPHIHGETSYALFFGQGFATAQDRRFQMETLWRAALGRTAEIEPDPANVPARLEADIQVRSYFYTDEERQALYDALPDHLQAMLDAYRDGINAYQDSMQANPSRYMPVQFTQLPLEPWTNNKTLALMQLLMRRFGQHGGEELERLMELQENGQEWFDENRPLNDPDAPVTIPGETDGGTQEMVRYTGPSVDADVIRALMERRRRATATITGMGVPPQLGSFAVIASGDHTTTGHVMLLGAPQLDEPQPNAKTFASEVELEGPNLHIGGMTVPGIPGVIIGRNEHFSWTLTSAHSDNTDTYIEQVQNTSIQGGYLYNGEYRPFEVLQDTVYTSTGADTTITILRTLHGPVVGLNLADNQVFTHKFAFDGRNPAESLGELEMLPAFYNVWQADNLQSFEAAIRQVTMGFNLFYAGTDQNIKYWHLGRFPDRADDVDPRLPQNGTGDQEWDGIIPFEELPQAANPDQGYFVNWNNKPVAWWNNGDNVPWVPGALRYDRVTAIQDHISSAGELSFAELKATTEAVRTYGSYPGTYQQALEFDTETAVRSENLVPPGQSGFVSINQVPSPHFADQWAYYQAGFFKNMIFSPLALEATLQGVNEVPPGQTEATGTVTASLDGDTLVVEGSFVDLSSKMINPAGTPAHIHLAGPAANGPITIALVVAASADSLGGTFEADANTFVLTELSYPGSVDADSVKTALMSGLAYVNVHTQNHPAGEIRGQLLGAPNEAPVLAAIQSPMDEAEVTLEGDAGAAFVVEWSPSLDPDGNEVVYVWQLAADADFNALLFNANAGTQAQLATTVGAVDTLLADAGVDEGGSVTLYHRALASDGSLQPTGEAATVTLIRGVVTAQEEPHGLPERFALRGNHPNPFSPRTTIAYDLPQAAEVTLALYDVLGRQVMTLPLGQVAPGFNQLYRLDGAALSSGVYFYRVTALVGEQTHTATGRMVLVK